MTKEGLVRNHAIGIRTCATLSSDEAWRQGHRAAAPYLLATAFAAYASAVVSAVVALITAGDEISDAVIGVVPGIGFLSILVLVAQAARVANKAARSVSFCRD